MPALNVGCCAASTTGRATAAARAVNRATGHSHHNSSDHYRTVRTPGPARQFGYTPHLLRRTHAAGDRCGGGVARDGGDGPGPGTVAGDDLRPGDSHHQVRAGARLRGGDQRAGRDRHLSAGRWPRRRRIARAWSNTRAPGRAGRCTCWPSPRPPGSAASTRSRPTSSAWPTRARLSSADESRLLGELPVVTWLMHAVHGNEISSSDAALAEAYHLLAARGDAMVDTILRESIVLIDPLENPDGRSRFLFQNKLGRAATPDGDRLSAEHDEPWPGGRSNHYLFDMNRDWFAQTQPETRGPPEGRARLLPARRRGPARDGRRLVVLLRAAGRSAQPVHHPGPDPLARDVRPRQRRALRRSRLRVLHPRGLRLVLSRVRRVVADLQRRHRHDVRAGVGARPGLHARRRHDAHLSPGRRASLQRRHHDRLHGRRQSRAPAARLSRVPPLRHHRGREGRDARVRPAAGQRSRDGRRGSRATWQGRASTCGWRARRSRSARATCLPAPTWSRRLSRRAGWCATCSTRTCRSPRRSSGSRIAGGRSGSAIRSTTSPGGACRRCSTSRSSRARRRCRRPRRRSAPTPAPWRPRCRRPRSPTCCRGAATRRAPCDALLERASACTRPVAASRSARDVCGRHRDRPRGANSAPVSARRWPRSPRGTAPPVVAARQRLGGLAASRSGSGDVVALKAPRVVLAWDAPTSSCRRGGRATCSSAASGSTVSAVRVSSLGRLDLDKVDVLVLPQGSYGSAINDDAVRRLREWMRGGGTLVTIGEASRWAAGEKVGLLDTRPELRGGKPDVEEKDKKPRTRRSRSTTTRPCSRSASVPRTRRAPWSGCARPRALARVGNRRRDPGHRRGPARLHAAEARQGHQRRRLRPEGPAGRRRAGVGRGADQLAQKAFLMHQAVGQGHIIAFAEEPELPRLHRSARSCCLPTRVLAGSGVLTAAP